MTGSGLLLDSNIVIWLESKSDRIPAYVMDQIKTSPKVFLSAVTAWELNIKQSIGSLRLARPVSDLLRVRAFTELPVTIRHGEAVRNLPFHHRDPFDRLLVAQAQVEGLILVTADRMLTRYGVPICLV